MNTHHTKYKGDLGVFKAQLDLYEKGYWVSIPLTENAPFDLIATKDGKSYTCQVKYRSKDKTGCLDVGFRTSWADKNGTHISKVDKSQIDLYIIYCPDNDTCYYLNPSNFSSDHGFKLRIDETKNNQNKGVIWAHDYLTPVV